VVANSAGFPCRHAPAVNTMAAVLPLGAVIGRPLSERSAHDHAIASAERGSAVKANIRVKESQNRGPVSIFRFSRIPRSRSPPLVMGLARVEGGRKIAGRFANFIGCERGLHDISTGSMFRHAKRRAKSRAFALRTESRDRTCFCKPRNSKDGARWQGGIKV
jgi:hypothetical protein